MFTCARAVRGKQSGVETQGTEESCRIGGWDSLWRKRKEFKRGENVKLQLNTWSLRVLLYFLSSCFSFLVLVHRPYSLDAEDTFTCVSQPTELNVRPANSLPSFHNATII